LFEAEHVLKPKASSNFITRDPALIRCSGHDNEGVNAKQPAPATERQSALLYSGRASGFSSVHLEKIEKLLLRELPHHIPLSSPSYSPAISQLNVQALQKEWRKLQEGVCAIESMTLSRMELEARKRGCWTFKGLTAAAVACLALVTDRRTDIRELFISGTSVAIEN
jgi:hypothetical protein